MKNDHASQNDLVLQTREGLEALTAVPGIGDKTALAVASHFETWNDMSQASVETLKGVVRTAGVLSDEPAIRAVCYFDAGFPKRLKGIDDVPALLYSWGTMPEGNYVAVIGTRDPDQEGVKQAELVAHTAAESGWIVVSGMAQGVDIHAHQAAMDAGCRTVAVIPDAFRQLKGERREFAKMIVKEGGCVLSRHNPASAPDPKGAPLERNPVVTGLADIVVVVQAKNSGGTMNAVKHAVNQQRKLLAVDPPAGAGEGWDGNSSLLDEDPEVAWLKKTLGARKSQADYGLPLAEVWRPNYFEHSRKATADAPLSRRRAARI